MVLLTQPRHIDSVSRRLKLLLTDLDRASTNQQHASHRRHDSRSNSPQPANPTVQEQLLPLLTRLGPSLPQIPHILTRLRTLSTLHTSAAEFQSTLESLEEEQRKMREALTELDGAVKTVESSLDANQSVVKGNVSGLEDRVDGLLRRLDGLSRSWVPRALVYVLIPSCFITPSHECSLSTIQGHRASYQLRRTTSSVWTQRSPMICLVCENVTMSDVWLYLNYICLLIGLLSDSPVQSEVSERVSNPHENYQKNDQLCYQRNMPLLLRMSCRKWHKWAAWLAARANLVSCRSHSKRRFGVPTMIVNERRDGWFLNKWYRNRDTNIIHHHRVKSSCSIEQMFISKSSRPRDKRGVEQRSFFRR